MEDRPSKEDLKAHFESIPKKSDTDWVQQSSSRPQRGIIDNAREIEFEHELTLEQLRLVKLYLADEALARCVGWTGVGASKMGATTYRFTTTWDSSD